MKTIVLPLAAICLLAVLAARSLVSAEESLPWQSYETLNYNENEEVTSIPYFPDPEGQGAADLDLTYGALLDPDGNTTGVLRITVVQDNNYSHPFSSWDDTYHFTQDNVVSVRGGYWRMSWDVTPNGQAYAQGSCRLELP